MKKAVLIVNPSSGNEEAQEYEKLVKEKLTDIFDEVEVQHTGDTGDATKFANQAVTDKVDSVFAMGGDGTVNEVISGLAEQEHRPKFGFFPLGTVNDLARSLNISMEPEEAVAELDLDRRIALDIGKVNEDYFMNIVAVGGIPEAISDVEVEEKTKFGKLAYFTSGFKQVLKDESYHFELEIEGEKRKIESSAVVIALTQTIGGYGHIVPEARPDDGKMYLIYLKNQNVLDMVKSVPDIIKGIDHSTDYIGYQPFIEGSLSVKEEVDLHSSVDGDEGPGLPLRFKILPQHLEVYVGPQKK
ncbi:diacylglycerol/lipid kinase family protein [Enterococcus alishanensis]|uniref:Diacylglycerol kinase family lipid kinase n=1 Tax=Enterococcus alishanensis TaxID=1303817 RepID=A0ABS6TA00_9ENTE|nr:diacylglycerol kinase family protein [Enterococcus alishanensis]MBV7389724.1 diacylglycerol kinase family lipid kinase [Enterococcus alishanensis]